MLRHLCHLLHASLQDRGGKPGSHCGRAVQAMLAMQLCVERVAAELSIPHSRVSEINLYRDGDSHPCGQLLEGLQVPSGVVVLLARNGRCVLSSACYTLHTISVGVGLGLKDLGSTKDLCQSLIQSCQCLLPVSWFSDLGSGMLCCRSKPAGTLSSAKLAMSSV